VSDGSAAVSVTDQAAAIYVIGGAAAVAVIDEAKGFRSVLRRRRGEPYQTYRLLSLLRRP
jgi:hypothetical protein